MSSSGGEATLPRERIAANLAAVRQRMAAACARSGRSIDDVRLVAVTKSASLDEIRALIALGVTDMGESRPQQLLSRASELPQEIAWHLIGSLQRNKARKILPLVSLIHSADSFRLLDALDRLAAELAIRPRVLLEVNVSGEESKQGFSPDELNSDIARLPGWRHLEICGLMTMAPETEDPEEARPTFRALRAFRDELQQQLDALAAPIPLRELSMGMSGDFEIAIEEGATRIRVGSLLFA